MALSPPIARVLTFCSLALALPAAVSAQDASIGFGQQNSSTQSSSTSQTSTTSQTTTGSTQDDTRVGGDNNFGATTTQSSITGSEHSETRSRSNTAEVDIDVHDNDDDWANDRHRSNRGLRVSDLFGNWTLGQEGGNSCTLQLKDNPWFGGYAAYAPAGCPDGFFSANRWVLSGNQLLITDGNNTVIGRFRQSGSGRWSGRRESDGARLYLNPTAR